MGILKPIIKSIDNSSGLRRVDPARARELINTAPKGNLGFIDDMAEYDRIAGDLERASEAPITHKEVQAEIVAKRNQEAEETRIRNVTSSDADPEHAFVYQTKEQGEFAERLNKQLRNPEYAALTVTSGADDVTMRTAIEASQTAHKEMVNRVTGKLRANPRWTARVNDWFEDSPYKDDVLFHVDKQTDPLRADSFIQFENPREMGLHAGTNAAAERVIGVWGPEAAALQTGDFVEQLEELAGLANIPISRINMVIADELTTFFERKFLEGTTLGKWNDEWKNIMVKVEAELGPDIVDEAVKIMSILKNMPTPNTTPMVFKGKNGLLLKDEGNFFPRQVADQLVGIFPDDADEIFAAVSAKKVDQSKNLQKFIESKGYDHIVYNNSVEDRGSVSIINWNPELQKSVWDADFVGSNPTGAASAAAAAMLAVMGIGAQNADVR
jgi:hypothetical protein